MNRFLYTEPVTPAPFLLQKNLQKDLMTFFAVRITKHSGLDGDYRMLLRESSLYATTSPFTRRRGTTASAATSAGRVPPAPS